MRERVGGVEAEGRREDGQEVGGQRYRDVGLSAQPGGCGEGGEGVWRGEGEGVGGGGGVVEGAGGRVGGGGGRGEVEV
ncbi:hypothetical protein B1218_34745, partial [Pseudomonas ogarae]